MKQAVKTITLKLSDNTMEKMKEYFEDKKRDKTPPYAVFQAKEADTTVTLYESGKALFQGISADIDANIWLETEKHLNPNKKVSIKKAGDKKKEKPNNKLHYVSTVGSDEVGTGDYFGPIVVTATYVSKENIPYLENLHIKDSKKLTDDYILKITSDIIKKVPYTSFILNNEDYNKSNLNLNAMKAILHNKVLLKMAKDYPNHEYIVIDQFTPPKTYYKYLENVPEKQFGITFVTKGEDKCLSVACAAIISRYIFLKEYEKLSKIYGNIPKGAGINVDKFGAELVKKYGEDVLNKIAKLNFKNTDKIKELVKN